MRTTVLTFAVLCCVGVAGQAAELSYKTITTIAGSGKTGDVVVKGRADQVPLSNPFGIQPQEDGSLIIASWDQHVIYRLGASYRSIEVILGTGEPGQKGKAGDLPRKVQLNQPHEIQVAGNGDIYVADTTNHRVGKLDGATGRWETVAGTGKPGFGGDDGDPRRAQFDQAYSIALDGNDLFVADLRNHRIRLVELDAGRVTTICGTGEKALPQDGKLAKTQSLAGPRSLAVDSDNLWIVLREGNSVWRLDRTTLRIHHVAGTGQKGFSGDGGAAKEATFRGPKGIAVDPGEAVFVADTENHAIRRIDLRSGQIATIVGTGKGGFNGDGDELGKRMLKRPHGVCLLPTGELLIGDSENHRVRMLVR
ncbi:MAG: hypothetical protein Aurels2KO_17800 [Aureliella sp.]